MNVYVVTAYRYGKRESHRYLVDVFSNEERAIREAISEEEYRGIKYNCEVIEVELDRKYTIDDVPYTVVYKLEERRGYLK